MFGLGIAAVVCTAYFGGSQFMSFRAVPETPITRAQLS